MNAGPAPGIFNSKSKMTEEPFIKPKRYTKETIATERAIFNAFAKYLKFLLKNEPHVSGNKEKAALLRQAVHATIEIHNQTVKNQNKAAKEHRKSKPFCGTFAVRMKHQLYER